MSLITSVSQTGGCFAFLHYVYALRIFLSKLINIHIHICLQGGSGAIAGPGRRGAPAAEKGLDMSQYMEVS